jgi:glycosyltransferase involved in cell wall biosynthesis
MDRVVCVSQGQADKVIRAGTPKNRIVVIHNAIDLSRFAEKSDPNFRNRLENYFDKPPRLIVGVAGRLSPEKGYDILIDAVAKTETEFGVVLFGDGFLRDQLQAKIDAAGISHRFKMVGFTNELDKFLPWFDVFVQSSYTEGFPCVNVEAMASRVPVLATSVGGVPEQIESERNGLLVPPNNPQALAAALERLLNDGDLRRRLGDEGRRRAEAEFTCRKQAEAYLDLFNHFLKMK